MKILVMGLPDTGKTHLSKRLQRILNCAWFNADQIRTMANDWNFDVDARNRQAQRMRNIADYEISCGNVVICDFVCPTFETRKIFQADFTIWCDTLQKCKYEDTNRIFEEPTKYHIRLKKWTDANRLCNYLEDGNHGTKATLNFLKGLSKKLDR